jgi:hypothetical protein
VPHGKSTHEQTESNDGEDEAATVAHASADGLSLRRQRPRHDEVQPPRGYELQPDGWPVWMPPKGSRKPTDQDKAIAHALIHRIKWTIGEADDWKPGPLDTIMNDDARARLEAAYKALTGRGYFERWDFERERIESCLASLLRLREQARVYRRIRCHKGKPDAPRADGGRFVVPLPPPPEKRAPGMRYHPGGVVDVPPIATTGAEIVEGLRRVGVRDNGVPLDRLALLIDELPEGAVNLGGAGGAAGGRTPEQWARSLVLALTDPDVYRADCEKRARRSGRHAAASADNVSDDEDGESNSM